MIIDTKESERIEKKEPIWLIKNSNMVLEPVDSSETIKAIPLIEQSTSIKKTDAYERLALQVL